MWLIHMEKKCNRCIRIIIQMLLCCVFLLFINQRVSAAVNPFQTGSAKKPVENPFQIGSAEKPAVWEPAIPENSKQSNLPDSGVLENPETVTLMIYMVGSDLESSGSAATNDMTEIAASGIDSSCANVLIYTGGSADWHSNVPNDANALFLLEEGKWTKLETYEQTSMGEPANLTQFLQYGYDNYPADSYGRGDD